MGATTTDKQRDRVLIVDDEEPVRVALSRALGRLGMDVGNAVDGEMGLQKVAAEKPDVVLLDLRMPGIDGHTFLRRLGNDPTNPAVIVMSGHGTMDDVIDVIRAGAVDYLRKPWNPTELVSAVTRALETRARKHKAATTPPPPPTPASTHEDVANQARAARSRRFEELLGKVRRGEVVLPSTPAVLTSIREMVASATASLEDIAALIEKDQRMTADILRVANSAQYARMGRVTNVKSAVGRLGVRHVHTLAETIVMQGLCQVRPGPCRNVLGQVWRRSVGRAVAMRALADVLGHERQIDPDVAYIIGLMADVGASLLLWVVSERGEGPQAAEDAQDEAAVIDLVRRTHVELGSSLLRSWKFGNDLILAVGEHHRNSPPARATRYYPIAVLGDHLAQGLANEDDVTTTTPFDPIVVEQCSTELRASPTVIERLMVGLRTEYTSLIQTIT